MSVWWHTKSKNRAFSGEDEGERSKKFSYNCFEGFGLGGLFCLSKLISTTCHGASWFLLFCFFPYTAAFSFQKFIDIHTRGVLFSYCMTEKWWTWFQLLKLEYKQGLCNYYVHLSETSCNLLAWSVTPRITCMFTI